MSREIDDAEKKVAKNPHGTFLAMGIKVLPDIPVIAKKSGLKCVIWGAWEPYLPVRLVIY